tara:strand:- start:35 stop:241 length:207 start_codon:yes stop_codon:yes gene_type:complete
MAMLATYDNFRMSSFQQMVSQIRGTFLSRTRNIFSPITELNAGSITDATFIIQEQVCTRIPSNNFTNR